MIARSPKTRIGQHLRNGTALTLVVMLAGGSVAMAQTTGGAAKPAAKPAGDDNTVIVITGTRASQRSSIDRKKNAPTATDSIVAEDIGAFPDKNVAEAISRVPGIQLDRGDTGEGQGISVRGQGAEVTRVETDGISNMSTGGGLGGSGGATRGSDFRELPSDMVKSIDVIKGTTAAMTEGSLGGTVRINTRSGLDFKKPFFQFRYGQQENTLSGRWTPNYNLIYGRKLFGGRLGVLTNIGYNEFQTNNDREESNTSGNSGYFRNADFDNSPNKTFSYNPSLVDPTATDGNFFVQNASGAKVYQSLSPIDIVKKSAAATTKQDCLAAFPALTSAQLALVPAGTNSVSGATTNNATASANQAAAQNEQANALQSCLNQWNDYTPSLIRLLPRQAYERRVSADIRVDYRVDDDLVVYFKASMSNRMADNRDNTLNLGSPSFNAAGTYQYVVNGTPVSALSSAQTSGTGTLDTTILPRSPLAGYYAYPNGVGGTVVSDISNAVVDASHHVTSMTLSDGNINIDAIHYHTQITSNYATAGFNFNHGGWKIEGFYNTSGSTFQRGQIRTAVNYTYGAVNMHVTPSGLWTYDLPTNINFADGSLYSAVKPGAAQAAVSANSAGTAPAVAAIAAANAAQFGNNYSLTYRPALSNDRENAGKLDFTYNFRHSIPFVSDVQFGWRGVTHIGNGYAGGGYTVKPGVGTIGAAGYVAPIVVPTNNLGTTFRSCLPGVATTVGTVTTPGQSCNYGYQQGNGIVGNSSVAILGSNSGVATFTPDQLTSIINSALYTKPFAFLGDYPNRGDALKVWPLLNPDVIAAAVGIPFFNYDCMKTCKGSDGKVYEQPHSAYREQTSANYFMFDFEQKLPWGMVFNGNAGTRYIHTVTNATGFMTFNHVSVTGTTTTIVNGAPVVTPTTATSTISLNTSVQGNSTDWTPSYNLNLWVRPNIVLRYYSGHVIARPSVTQLLPSGNCSISDLTLDTSNLSDDQVDQVCTGRVGNPALKPYKAINHNESVEWYINKDTMVSLAYYYNNVLIGGPINANVSNSFLFAGTDFKDPVTGVPLSQAQFTYPSYVNGPSGLQRGVEFNTKIAFSFLPWFLKYTGTDFNYSKLGNKNFATSQDLVTGTFLPPQGAAGYFENWSLWYDDGRLNARLAYQGRDQFFDFISSCSNAINNYPTAYQQCSGQTIRTPYNPGGANYRSKTQFLDLKINYKVNKNWEMYAQGRNILRAETSSEKQKEYDFSNGTPSIEYLNYSGATFEFGFTFRN